MTHDPIDKFKRDLERHFAEAEGPASERVEAPRKRASRRAAEDDPPPAQSLEEFGLGDGRDELGNEEPPTSSEPDGYGIHSELHLDDQDRHQDHHHHLDDQDHHDHYLDDDVPFGGTESVDAKTETNGISLDDFRAYMPQHCYIYLRSREPWPATSINARFDRVPIVDADGNPVLNTKGNQKELLASTWLDQNRPVEQMTWAPGQPDLIADRLVSHGGWIKQPGVTCLNLYLPPTVVPGNAAKAEPWLSHVRKVFPDAAEHIVQWLAHRVQRPAEKINHALVLGGAQGIGKDTLLEPLKGAVGPWNFLEVSPQQMLGRFNGFVKAVILRVNEARDLGDLNRYQFYDHLKAYTAAPPDVLRVDEKNLREHSIFNCCGVILTTNHKADGIYLPPDDRRHFVAWSDLTKDDFTAEYWNKLWRFYRDGGSANVAAYLASLDLSGFDPKAPPPKTQAFWEIVDASRAPEDAELADVIESLGSPAALTLAKIAGRAQGDFAEWLRDRKNARRVPHRLEACGYVAVRNDAAKDGLWKVGGKRQVIYAKAELSLRDRIGAAQDIAGI
jgi:Family of unknown function (DUF5906)